MRPALLTWEGCRAYLTEACRTETKRGLQRCKLRSGGEIC